MRLGSCVRKLFLSAVFFGITTGSIWAATIPQIENAYNGLFFRNSEVLLDLDQNGQVSTGDIFWGVVSMNGIVAPTNEFGQVGPTIWPAPGQTTFEITGYFATQVAAVLPPPPGAPASVSTIVFGPTASPDPNGVLAAGEVLRIYASGAVNFNDATQGQALATATDGNLVWSFGLQPSSDGTSSGGYWYSLVPTAIPGTGPVGESYAGLNVILAPPGSNFGPVNDPNEGYSNLPDGLDVQFWFNSEIFRLPGNPGLTVGSSQPMHFGSNDPAVYYPLPPEICVDIKKQVSVDGLPLLSGTQWNPAKVWLDANTMEDAPTTGMAAAYRLIVENCGDVLLTNVKLNDIYPTSTDPETIKFEDVNIGDLQPGEVKVIAAGWIGGMTGDVSAFDGFAGLDAPYRCLDEWVSINGAPEGVFLNTAEVTTDQGASDNDPAWVNCRLQEGACRMTGGSVTINNFFDAEGDARVFAGYVDGTYSSEMETVTTGKGRKAVTETTSWVTTGGQIGAPSTDPATGHWTHTQHAGAEGIFTFLAGTASAPPGTEISNIDCADPGWCVQARCAPFKQIFWDGIGYFPNKHGGEEFNAAFPSSTCMVTPGGPSRDGTLHYFRAMVGDFGENDSTNRQISASQCDWLTTGGGPSGFDVSEVVELDASPNAKFGVKGGQDCDKCPDYYQIEIYCGASKETKGEVIYTFRDFIDDGNFQIHPETSEQCTADLFIPNSKGKKK